MSLGAIFAGGYRLASEDDLHQESKIQGLGHC